MKRLKAVLNKIGNTGRLTKYLVVAIYTLLLNITTYATVVVFPNPDPANSSGLSLQSKGYQIIVQQDGKRFESFVYQSQTNFEKPEQQSDRNHWTTFEFSGSITITVTKLDGDWRDATLYPLRHELQVQQTGARTVSFTISKPCKLMLESADAAEDPLFIFADALAESIPNKKSKNAIVFAAGKVHNIGLQYKVPAGSTVVIEGGAVVWGTLFCEEGEGVTTITGKGIITTRSDERKPGAPNIPFSTIYSGKTDIVTTGITITDPVHFCIIGRGKVETRNVKLFAWYHQTDGWGGGDNSFIEDSFIKVFDDNVKLYYRNQRASGLVIYQQHNGAPFQLSWGGQMANHCVAEDIDIIKCWVNKQGGIGNSAVLNARHGSTKDIQDVTIRNLRADQGIYQLIGIGNDKDNAISGLRLEDISVKGSQQQASYLINSGKGSVANVLLREVKINGKCFAAEHILLDQVSPDQLKISCDD